MGNTPPRPGRRGGLVRQRQTQGRATWLGLLGDSQQLGPADRVLRPPRTPRQTARTGFEKLHAL